jgi:hypothetical protein
MAEHPLETALGWLCILALALAIALWGDAISAGPPPNP